MPDQVSRQEFAAQVKAKYPDYANVPDDQLVDRMLEKYPVYRDRVAPAPETAPHASQGSQGGLSFLQTLGASGSAPQAMDLARGAGRFASGVGEMLNPVTMVKGLASAVAHPIDTVSALANAQIDQGYQAADMFGQGRYSEAIGHSIAAALPMIGPVAAGIGEQIGSGDIAGGMGRAAGLGATVLAPSVVRSAKPSIGPRAPQLNPMSVGDESIQFAQSRGIPMSAGTATGNPVVRGIERLNEHSGLVASHRGATQRAAQGEALRRVGDRLASSVHPTAVSPEIAGQAVRDLVSARAAAYDSAADAAYSRLRELEMRRTSPVEVGPSKRVTSPILDSAGKPLTRTIPPPTKDILAVDIAPVKSAMTPIYESLVEESKLVPPMGDKGRAVIALDRLMRAPDNAPLSVADSVLSDLKAAARVDHAFQRTAGQGIAAETVKHLDKSVRNTALKGGPDVFNALMEGRAATVNKHKTAALFKRLRDEPQGVFSNITAPKDAAIGKLREIAKAAPDAMPQIGRAYLEDLLSTATSEGGFTRAATVANKWKQLGPQTKSLLFKDPSLVNNLDNFFRFARRAAENPNPSGSATLGSLGAKGAFTYMNPLGGVAVEIGQAVLGELLWNPAVVKLLNRAMTTPINARKSALDITSKLAPYLAASAVSEAAKADQSSSR